MEGLHTVKALKKRDDFMAKVDLKDAFMILIGPQFRRFLLFKLKEKTYQFNCLPFGLCTAPSSAPRVFTKILKPAVEMLRSQGVRLVIYMDDMLLMAESKQANRTRPVDIVSPRESGAYCQLQEVYSGTISGNRVSGDDCQLHIDGSEIARRENKENPSGSLPSVKSIAANCPAAIPASRQAEHLSCSSNDSLILPRTPDLSETDVVRQSAGLSSSGQAVSPSHGRPSVVDTPPLLLE